MLSRCLPFRLVAHCSLLIAPFAVSLAASPQLVLSTHTILPGDSLRVETDGISPDTKLKVVFGNKSYACFPVGPNAQRALIGIPLGTTPGSVPLDVRPALPKAKSLLSSPEMVLVSSRAYPTENVNFSSEKTSLMTSEHRESTLIHQKAAILTSEQLWEGAFVTPVQGPRIAPFGLHRLRNGHIEAGFHKGLDVKAPQGTPLVAANAGVVLLASPLRAHGKTVLINHGQGVMSIYLHMSSLLVKPGQEVAKGQVIGKVGQTGLATAPHVHWQIFVHGVPVDPDTWMENEF